MIFISLFAAATATTDIVATTIAARNEACLCRCLQLWRHAKGIRAIIGPIWCHSYPSDICSLSAALNDFSRGSPPAFSSIWNAASPAPFEENSTACGETSSRESSYPAHQHLQHGQPTQMLISLAITDADAPLEYWNIGLRLQKYLIMCDVIDIGIVLRMTVSNC